MKSGLLQVKAWWSEVTRTEIVTTCVSGVAAFVFFNALVALSFPEQVKEPSWVQEAKLAHERSIKLQEERYQAQLQRLAKAREEREAHVERDTKD